MVEEDHPRPVGDDRQKFIFKNVQLFKNETLGTGSYGAVCKAKCDQLICAAKLLYPVLFQTQAPDPGKEHRQPFHRFEQECQFLSRINHPNIVQYLGTYRDLDTNTPVLLMELMDESLTHFLESSPVDIPYYIQVNLSQDIAQALAFLHANGIIHRDLSSNNVQLIAGNRAKVSDFGILKFVDVSKSHLATMTQCPGTLAFMSPESLDEPPVCTEKLDNFSLGVLLVQIVTRQLPTPSDRFETVLIPSRRDSTRTVKSKVPIPEVERRQAHISLIEPTHPLLPIALECLRDEAEERPSSQELCQSLEALKKAARYEESTKQDDHQFRMDALHEQEAIPVENQDLVQSLRDMIEAKERKLKGQEEVIQTKDEVLLAQDVQLQSLQREFEAKKHQLRRLNQQLESNEEITATLQQTITQRDWEIGELRDMLAATEQSTGTGMLAATEQSAGTDMLAVTEQSAGTDMLADRDLSAPTGNSLSLVWESLPYNAIEINGASCALMGDKAYFRSCAEVWEFNFPDHQWNKLCNPPVGSFDLVDIGTLLTTVGGCSRNKFGKIVCSNGIYSHIDKKWVESFPPMPTKRWACAAMYANFALIVAGGDCDCTLTKRTAVVEILNVVTKQWTSVSSLPFPTSWPSLTLCGESIYLNSGYTSSENEYSAMRCSFSDLIQSTSTSHTWNTIAALPVSSSTLVAVKGHLLAVGGVSVYGDRTKHIHHYDSSSNSWQVISRMSIARSSCCAVCLPNNKLMVVGGNSGNPVTEMASVSS